MTDQANPQQHGDVWHIEGELAEIGRIAAETEQDLAARQVNGGKTERLQRRRDRLRSIEKRLEALLESAREKPRQGVG